jgi:hypothetical protein
MTIVDAVKTPKSEGVRNLARIINVIGCISLEAISVRKDHLSEFEINLIFLL